VIKRKIVKINLQKLIMPKHLTIVMIALFVGSLALRVYYSNDLAVKNSELQRYYNRKECLEKDISTLEFQNSTLSCMQTVEERALNAGFIPMDAPVSLLDTSAVDSYASLPDSVTASLGL
jgi:hypothetical protein